MGLMNKNMINILSYQQPIKGKIIKEWIAFHTTNKTEYSRIAAKMLRYMNVKDDRLYRINLRPSTSACGEYKRYNPDIVLCDND
jgi:hypothetical protein